MIDGEQLQMSSSEQKSASQNTLAAYACRLAQENTNE